MQASQEVKGSSSPRPPIAGPTASPSTSPTKPSSTDTRPTRSSPPSSGWSKQFGPKLLKMTDGGNVDLDLVPPNVNADGSVIFQLTGNQFYDFDDLVKWTGTEPGTASAAACSDLINEQGTQDVPVVRATYSATITIDRTPGLGIPDTASADRPWFRGPRRRIMTFPLRLVQNFTSASTCIWPRTSRERPGMPLVARYGSGGSLHLAGLWLAGLWLAWCGGSL